MCLYIGTVVNVEVLISFFIGFEDGMFIHCQNPFVWCPEVALKPCLLLQTNSFGPLQGSTAESRLTESGMDMQDQQHVDHC